MIAWAAVCANGRVSIRKDPYFRLFGDERLERWDIDIICEVPPDSKSDKIDGIVFILFENNKIEFLHHCDTLASFSLKTARETIVVKGRIYKAFYRRID